MMAHTSSFFRISTLATVFAGFGFLSTPAHAGFEWTPGPKAGSAETAAAAPTISDMPPLAPMPSEKVDSDALMKTPSPPLPPLPAPPMMGNDVSAQSTAPNMPTPTKAPAATPRSANVLPDAVGFGSDLPLALGMHQIVPAQYAYQFDQGVDQGAKISWNGGKPWDIALNDAVKPLGYRAVVEGNSVHIITGNVTAAPPATQADVTPAAPVAPPMAMRAGGDMPQPPLSPADAVPAQASPAPAPDATQPVREVYVRRHAAGTEVEERAPGKPEIVPNDKPATMSATDNGKGDGDEKSGFWNRVNPMNWQQDTDSKPSAYTVNRTAAGTVSTAKEVPPPPSYGNAPDVGPVARMSDNDARIAATNEPVGKLPVPDAPDTVADDVSPAPAAPSGGPVMLTRGPGEVSPPAPAPKDKDSVFDNKASNAPAAVLNTAEVGMWDAKQGDSLKTVLQNWSDKAQVQLYWVPAQDYKLPKPIHLQGNYTDAVAGALGAYGEKGARPVGRLHPNLPNGPSVLIIEPAAT